MTDADLLRSLRDCFSPADGRDIVTANLVVSAHLVFDATAPGTGIAGVPKRFIARIILRAPTSNETLNAQLEAQISNRLAGFESISRTEIELLPPLLPILG